jgi:hypothetical protein
MRRATPAIPPKMYRHFAVVTILLTAVLALFADGENGEAARALVAQQAANPPPAGPPRLVQKAPVSAWSSDGDDSGFEFGSPMENLVGSDGGGIFPDLELAQEAGYSEEYLTSLSPEERELLLKGLQENGMLSPEAHDSRARSLAAASDRRSGAPDGDD